MSIAKVLQRQKREIVQRMQHIRERQQDSSSTAANKGLETAVQINEHLLRETDNAVTKYVRISDEVYSLGHNVSALLEILKTQTLTFDDDLDAKVYHETVHALEHGVEVTRELLL